MSLYFGFSPHFQNIGDSSTSYGFAPMASFGVGGGNFINESAPLAGVEGEVEIEGSLRNDSVPISGNIEGNYEYSHRGPRSENHSWGVSISGIDLSSTEAFSRTFERAIRSGIVGYAAGRTAQALGAGDFASSLIGSLASAYASASGESRDGLSSLGRISEERNGHELEVEVVGFNRDLFNQELNQIKENIFAEALNGGFHFSNASNSSMEPLMRNLAKRATVFSRFSRDFVTTMERLLKAASQCLCRPLLRSIGGV